MKVWVIGRNVPAAWNNMTGVFELEQAKMLAAHGVEVVYPVVDLFSLRHALFQIVDIVLDHSFFVVVGYFFEIKFEI